MSRFAFNACGFTSGETPQLTTPESGWFFPWPRRLVVPVGSLGPGGYFPAGITPADFFKVYDRYRTYIISGSVSYSGTDRAGDPQSDSFTLSGTGSRIEDLGEVSLIASRSAALTLSASSTHPGSLDGGLSIANASDPTAPAVVVSTPLDGDLFYPRFATLTVQFTAGLSAVELISSWLIDYEPMHIAHEPVAFTVNFLGYSIPFHRKLNGPPNADTFSVGGTLYITPETYWEYRDGAAPIYDSTTGAQMLVPTPRDLSL